MCFRPAQVEKPIKCPNCGCMNQFTQMKCKKCKEPLPNGVKMVHCPNCGRDSLLTSGSCDDCALSFDEIRKMIEDGKVSIQDVIVHPDGTPLDWTKESFDLQTFGGSSALSDMPPAPMTASIPAAPKAPGAPQAPSAPKPPML